MKICLVHDWLVALGGGERCLEAFHELWPEAPLYTLVCSIASAEHLGFERNQIHTSFIHKMRKAQEKYRSYLPFFPLAIEQFDLSEYEVILSSSHCVAKGVLTRADQVHICYCHTPVRYAWDLTHQYLRENNLQRGIKSMLARIILHYIRMWDVQTANRVDKFLANSQYTARRIWRAYRREAEVVYPPVDVERFQLVAKKDDYFLFLSRLVPYKKADLVVQTFTKMGLPLVVAGDGPQMNELKKIAGKNVELIGYQSDDKVTELVSKARALVFAAEEDFGIVPVEAQAAGTPVIAYARGGARETVISVDEAGFNVATGLFFHEQTVESLVEAVNKFLHVEDRFDRAAIRKNAERFSKERFKNEIKAIVDAEHIQKSI